MDIEWSQALVPVKQGPMASGADRTHRSAGQNTSGQCLGGHCQDLLQTLSPSLLILPAPLLSCPLGDLPTSGLSLAAEGYLTPLISKGFLGATSPSAPQAPVMPS